MVVLVKDIMTRSVVTVDENRTVKYAGELMKKTRKGTLIVTRKNRPVGIVTDSDMIRKVISKNAKPSELRVKMIMSKPLVTIKPSDDIVEATRKMKRSNIKRLPVVEGGKIVGIISLTDIARTSPEMLDLLEYRLKMREAPFEIKEKVTSGVCDSCGNYSQDLQNVRDQWLCESCRDELEAEY
ncbi:MAG: CBS domain-containing protein [Candidatus Aenigmarchaeota archaeon]|nr:CBS domain-containing protein [Candidatus Aenigmarchaeota archaeon]